MIFGIGIDICEIDHIQKNLDSPKFIERFFNINEIKDFSSEDLRNQHYAARFAAKEAFAKALGTGVKGFELKDVYVVNDEQGKPFIKLENNALDIMKSKCTDFKINLSLSHEKNFAAAFVVIEQ